MSLDILECKIEKLRGELIKLVEEKGSFIDEEVVYLSEKLDVCIAKVQEKMNTLNSRGK